jgi:uncharacterized repeat protein (TIGR01451 family)
MSYVRRLDGVGARWFGGGLLVLALGVLALAGGATVGQAANQPSILFPKPVVLNDLSSTIPGQPSPGGNIGYTVTVSNSGTSTANHITVTETINAGTLVYVSTTGGLVCPAVTSTPVSTLTCSIDKIQPNASISVTTLFRTDPSALPGSNVTTDFVVGFDSQTNGQPNRKTLTDSITRKIAGNADGSLAQSITLHGEKLAATGAGQTSDLTMPDGFLNNFPYVGAQLLNTSDSSPCVGCAPFETDITIPPASTFGTGGPFLNTLLEAKPFKWSLTLPGALLPKSFKLHGVYHDDALLSMCAVDSSGNPVPPTAAPGICVATLQQTPNTKTITATGLAVTNGSYQFG